MHPQPTLIRRATLDDLMRTEGKAELISVMRALAE